MRLIDADNLSTNLLDISYPADEDVIWQMVQDEPNIDAVPVVRCEDCIYWWDLNDDNGIGYCCNYHAISSYVSPDDFCSKGERNEGAD